MSDERKEQARRLVINEAVRSADFARLAMNETETADVLEDVKQLYNIEDNELVFKEEWDNGGE